MIIDISYDININYDIAFRHWVTQNLQNIGTFLHISTCVYQGVWML